MTSTVQAPPPAPVRPVGTTEGPPAGPRSRRWLLGFWAVVFVLLVAVQPGRQTFDTKLGVTTDPWQFLADLGQLWHDRGGFGGIQDQYVGYAWPMLPYYGLTDAVGLPVWLAERLWLSLIVSVAFWGALRLAERLGVGSPPARLVAAAAYALWPVFTTVVGSTSAAALPGAFLPWVLLPLTNERYSARVAALRSALFIPFMGGVNAAATLASLLPVGLYLLTRPRGPRQRKLIAWWVPGVLLATAWWVVPLLLLGVYGENFLPYVESSQTTTAPMSATEALRGAGNWVAYLNFGEAWLPAGWSVAASVIVIVCSALAAGLGLAGLARRDMPERRWLVLTVLVVALITLAGYGGSFGAPFHGVVQDWLNAGLASFRNIYKFQTGLALALVLGLAHLVGVAVQERGARRVRGRRFAPLVAAVLVLPGLLWPYLNGSVLQPGSFQELPKYWQATADWLEKYSPDSRALVVPATAHGIYTWGSTIDQPLDVLADSRWAQRDYVPFGTPGNRRAMDAVEQALLTGGQVPGLADYLSRAGLYYVVVRNDLDPDQIGYVPTTTVKRTLEQSGYERVTGLGPVMTGGRIAEDTPLQVEGLYPRQRAVEIYRPAEGVPRPGQAGLKAIADTAVVSGGPESLLPLAADPQLRDRATVLTGDNHPGLGTPAVQVVGDGLRLADTRFGLVNANTSYTYTADERNPSGSVQDPGRKPKQILPVRGLGHQTVAELRGAAKVTASTSGNWLFHLPQYDPVNAFDGDPATAWAEGAPGSANGQWLRIDFDEALELPSTFEVTPLPQDGVRSAPTRIKVETERGSRSTNLQADGSTQTVNVRPGDTSWLKITILDSAERHAGIVGAGFSEIEIPGVEVTRMLRLPTDAEVPDVTEADAEVISLHRATDPTGLSPTGTEPGLHRTFATSTAGTYEVRATAVPVPGEDLDQLLYDVAPEQQTRITATADSTAALGAGLSPRNLTDGDLTTAWIAGDDPTIHLSWGDKWPISSLVLAPAGGLSTRPTQVEISSPDGAVIAGVDENGWVRFDPITTDQLDITITETAPLTLHNPVADDDLRLPVGLTEAYIPALDQYRTPQPAPTREFELPCGEGPVVEVDGKSYETSAKGTVRDLVERRAIEVTVCQGSAVNPELELGSADRHTVESEDSGALAVTDVTLTRGTVAEPSATGRDLGIRDWLGDRREVTVGEGAASYLTTYENFNEGWTATLGGRELTPVRLDGWQQGWRIPGGAGGTVKLSYEPSVTYEAGLIGAGVGLAALVGLALWRRREPNPDAPQPVPPGPGLWLGTVALTLVGIVIAGFFALLVPLLALLAWKRHALLVPIAFLALTGAGIAAAVGAGEPVAADEGAFGPVAQLLALIGLFAALVTVGAGAGVGSTAAERPGSTLEFGVPPGAEAPTEPLPQRRRTTGRAAAPSAAAPAGTGGGPTGSATGGPAAGPTISARGPGSPQPNPAPASAPDPDPDLDPPTRRIPFTKPRFRATQPEDEGGRGGSGAGGVNGTGGAGSGTDGKERGEPT
ncbi:alpha-(1-_3)-arabinofuranosyltransferase domain-containing protein [Streptomyces ipomoeae]|uniref:alpha-(1->3)-arabinofuranosyltransferase domain-containing protein n=1 Tax=Streptomyces ipomoeae TaxID=103232 RepID=UPI0029B6EB23|nr:alpha-(1->3)-arabinofuranosyltransferase family protein [Streptomyces ipomoeae]MDX2696669.1 alpha-(1->3)-arabinofuranosyltransferase family protein [Streptomyces ipomoeae]MDX2838533.1 alpha-(1->3)-arabinofuranosyltransferase family protein [Streptomyces ipomoeae]